MSIAPETKPQTKARVRKCGPFFRVIGAFFSSELFAIFLLTPAQGRSLAQLWPLAFGLLWAAGLSCLLRLLNQTANQSPCPKMRAVFSGDWRLFLQ